MDLRGLFDLSVVLGEPLDVIFFGIVSFDFAETLVFFDLPPVFFGLVESFRFIFSIFF